MHRAAIEGRCCRGCSDPGRSPKRAASTDGKRAVTDRAGAYTIGGLDADLVFELAVIHDGHMATFVKRVDPSAGPAPVAVLASRTPAWKGVDEASGAAADPAARPQPGLDFLRRRRMLCRIGPSTIE